MKQATASGECAAEPGGELAIGVDAAADGPVDKVNKWRNGRLCTAFREHRRGLTEDFVSANVPVFMRLSR